MAGQEIHSSHKAQREAKKMVDNARVIFTTCIGAGLGLLRDQYFEIVVIDEASQQTEPASLVPITKGCLKAILVGDHVQLRPTVQPHALAQEFDVSLFERLYKQPDGGSDGAMVGLSRVMLDTQYRMHRSICEFPSEEFYDSNLKTGIQDDERPMFPSGFPWPHLPHVGGPDLGHARMVFVECSAREELGQKSKSNKGQAALCAHIVSLLHKDELKATPPPPPANTAATSATSSDRPKPSIAVLTPYAQQFNLLKASLSAFSNVEACSIDGFQGKEADIVVFVTVRCNEHREIGFLKDLRRMNVALTRAKTGLIVIGNAATLTTGTSYPESTAMWKRLLARLTKVPMNLEDSSAT